MNTVLTHTSKHTGITSYHEYRNVYLIPQGDKFRVTRHYWHGAYRPQLFSSMKEAVAYIDQFLDTPTELIHRACDGFLCIETKKEKS